MTDTTSPTRRRLRLGRHLRRNLVAYLALFIAVTMTPLPSWAAGKITSKQILNNTIKSIDVRDNNLKGIDIRDGSLTKADLAAGARGFTSIRTKRVSVADVDPGTSSTRDVVCPAGSIAIGGGGYAAPTGLNFGASFGHLVRSLPTGPVVLGGSTFYFPVGDNATAPAWRTNVENTGVSATTIVHYAMCASK